MGTIEFKGEPPFALTIQQSATPTATGGNVLATFLVSAPGAADQAIELHVKMTLEIAQQIVERFPAAIEIAIRERWAGR